ncbi:MAG: LamG domain-containing protein, partial [Tangfeifania sp.]
LKHIQLLFAAGLILSTGEIDAKEFTETTFLIAEIDADNINSQQLWNFLESNNRTGVETELTFRNNDFFIAGTNLKLEELLGKIHQTTENDSSKVFPVFFHLKEKPEVLDSIIRESLLSQNIFYLPRGEAWPPVDYLVQANRRILFFVSGNFENRSKMLHKTENYALKISADDFAGINSYSLENRELNLELLTVDEFEKLPTQTPPNSQSRNLVPDYINFLLRNWTKFGKRPNFIFAGKDILNFDFILSQLQSFTWINGTVKAGGKMMEKVYWRSQDVAVTGGHFSFPYRGGEEISISPFAPGYRMTPEHIIVTGEMEVPENYSIIATPLDLGDGLTGNFQFEEKIDDKLAPEKNFTGENFTFTQDVERGTVLKLPENASVNLGPPENYGLRNNSFTVSCFVKFNEIPEYGDNAILGNYESEYRRGLHLILRSGHPYFGLWANDYVSDIKLKPNTWYHLVWRYIIETGEQAIFLNGKNIGSSTGHPPFSGTGDIHLGSALSQGASLRGYIDDLYFWDRPLGPEEINRLSLNETISLENEEQQAVFFDSMPVKIGLVVLVLILLGIVIFLVFKKRNPENSQNHIHLPKKNDANQINLFGGFRAINKQGDDISALFTPKVKELFLFVLFGTLKNENGAPVSEINGQLWPGLPTKKVTNNRAVTLNKLRKILQDIEGVGIVSSNGYLFLKMEEPFFCDYAEAYHLCQVPGGISKQQLETFFHLIKKGRFLKEHHWTWLDEMRGYTESQVIDNLLKLASVYKKENKPHLADALARRILEYDDLNEEAIYLQIWTLQQSNNTHLAKFHFDSFRTKFSESIGESYALSYEEFIQTYSEQV